MAVTQRDFVAVAHILATARQQADSGRDAVAVVDDVTVDLAAYFEQQNERFDRGRFLRAAGRR